ncbi:MAG: thiolase family protein [Deltaproteobacteria bacterium]|nr:MAG: thiolase family protein [Deltaproteobacteria bacterium]
MPEGEQGMNVARIATFLAGFPESVSAMTLNRFCSSGLQAIWHVCTNILAGSLDVAIAGGTESMSMIPMGGNKIVPNLRLAEEYPDAYVSMGQTAENVAKRYEVTREEQDRFALLSHERALAAIERGDFRHQIVPLKTFKYDGRGNRVEFTFDTDEGPRPSTLEALSKLPPAFANPATGGTVTAGNSSQMSDGAAALLLMERKRAEELGCRPLAKLHGFVTVGVDPAVMGIGPALAIPKLMERVGKPLGVSLEDIDCCELNEAFASQAVYCIRELAKQGLDPKRVNPNGGAIALGHPLGATGAKLATQLVYWLKENKRRWGIVSMCVGGGMGAAGLFENLTL